MLWLSDSDIFHESVIDHTGNFWGQSTGDRIFGLYTLCYYLTQTAVQTAPSEAGLSFMYTGKRAKESLGNASFSFGTLAYYRVRRGANV